jgi:2-dehydropantoate 2-reductase
MKILIIGSGCTGGLIGARLIERSADVTFLTRPERRVQLVTRGLQLRSQFGQFRRPVHAITPDEISRIYDLVIIATRAHMLEEAIVAVGTGIGAHTIVLPVIEGNPQFEITHAHGSPRILGAVLEARMLLDADGVLAQRSPEAELHIGAVRRQDEATAHELVQCLAGRGLTTLYSDRIQAEAWERFCFMAAAVAVNATTGLSLRDAVPPTHHLTAFARRLNEGASVGEALGLRPSAARIASYRHAFRMETRPVQPPALVNQPGRGGDEAVHLLIEMVAIAERAGVPVPGLRAARNALIRPREIAITATDITDYTVAV